jgi:hypothetical protein
MFRYVQWHSVVCGSDLLHVATKQSTVERIHTFNEKKDQLKNRRYERANRYICQYSMRTEVA